jgi:dTDP-4-dehydrorhamnose 3,5-epimerase
MLEILNTPIEDLIVLKPDVFADERGDFFETYNKNPFTAAGIADEFVQDNQSRSAKNVLRGLHFQDVPFEQGKLVRVVRGEALDVAVDIRKNSKTYLKHYSVLLTGENNLMLWIPPGFAHGFLSLMDDTLVCYKCTQFYNKQSEKGIRWNDEQIGIDWGIRNPVLSEKDSVLPLIKDLEIVLK